MIGLDRKKETHMKTKAFLFILLSLMVLGNVEVKGQTNPQPLPDPQVSNPPEDWWLQILFNNHFRMGGVETGISNYGYSVGLPVFWVGDQLKVVPVIGWFWASSRGWSRQGTIGGKALYFLNKQQSLSKREINPYIGGFSLTEGDYHNSGIAVGFEPKLSNFFKLGFELQAGLRSEYGEDKPFGGAAITIGFGW